MCPSVQCTLYTVQCTVYTVHCTLYSVQCTPSKHCTLSKTFTLKSVVIIYTQT